MKGTTVAEGISPGDKYSHLPRWQVGILTTLTLVYLIVELAFNSRLLDLVGSIASAEQIHSMERYGRSLTSFAIALLVLQLTLYGLSRRKRKGKKVSPRTAVTFILFCCLLSAVSTWYAVEQFIEHQVMQSSSTFRQTALMAQLYQQALINGSQTLEGIPLDENGEQRQTWQSPSGKAFLAMLPLLLSGVERFHLLMAKSAEQNLRDNLTTSEGGVRGFYTAWLHARQDIRRQYDDYYNDRLDLSEVIREKQVESWERYETELYKHHLTPQNVPFYYTGRVRAMVRRQGVPVFNRWRPSDQDGFNDAVALKVYQQYRSQRSVKFKGITIPKRLNWGAFFALDVIQNQLKQSMHIPASVKIRVNYPLNDGLKTFFTEVQQPHLNLLVKEKLPLLLAPTQSFAQGNVNAVKGESAARAVLVPPIALMFSLCGALTHLTKLLYLLIVQILPVLMRRWPSRVVHILSTHPLLLPSGVMCAIVLSFSFMNNSITSSTMYGEFRHSLADEAVRISNEPFPLSAGSLLNIVQTVSIGQSYTWPFNNILRKTVLGGFNFGFKPTVYGEGDTAD